MNQDQIRLLALVGIFILVAVNAWIVGGLNSLTSPVNPAVPANTSGNVPTPTAELISIVNSNCKECVSLEGLVQSVSQQGIQISSKRAIEYDSSEAKELIQKYDIQKVPALIFKADAAAYEKLAPLWESVGRPDPSEKTLIFPNPPPVFFDLNQNRARGLVNVTLLEDQNCSACQTIATSESLAKSGIAVQTFSKIQFDSPTGTQLVQQYRIRRIPALVFSAEIEAYESIWTNLLAVGTLESDTNFVLRQTPAPYLDLDSNRLVGKVQLTIVDYPECTACFDANMYTKIWPQTFGVFLDKIEFFHYPSIDANKLVQDYNITKLPTAILGGDINAYPALLQRWPQLGIIATDQNYVFTAIDQLGQVTFYDLNQGKTVQTAAPAAQ